jgi:hypothetical protein
VKGVFGSPLCLDVTKEASLLTVGFDDDTFVIYGLNFFNERLPQIQPLCRAVGHKSFVCQVKFDYYAMDYFAQAALERETAEDEEEDGC